MKWERFKRIGKKYSRNLIWVQCRRSLVSKNLSTELQNMFDVLINFIEKGLWKQNYFQIYLKKWLSDHKLLFYYYKVRWLSRTKGLWQRIFELKKEMGIFLRNNNLALFELFSNTDFRLK